MQRARVILFSLSFVVFSSVDLLAENRLTVESKTVGGNSSDSVVITATHDIDLYGFSFGISYDNSKISITDVTTDGALAQPPDFFNGQFDNGSGIAGYGCVFDFAAFGDGTPDPGGFDTILTAAGSPDDIVVVSFDVLVAGPDSTTIALAEAPINPSRPVKNVMTNDMGQSEAPLLTDGVLTITDVVAGVLLRPGDVNRDGKVDLSDGVGLLNFLFAGNALNDCYVVDPGAPVIELSATGMLILNFNGDGAVNIADAVAELNWLFAGGFDPHDLGADCIEFQGTTCTEKCVN